MWGQVKLEGCRGGRVPRVALDSAEQASKVCGVGQCGMVLDYCGPEGVLQVRCHVTFGSFCDDPIAKHLTAECSHALCRHLR